MSLVSSELSSEITTPARPFAPGDVVRLRSGGPAMTVEGAAGPSAECVWVDGGVIGRGVFPVVTLETSSERDRLRSTNVVINNHVDPGIAAALDNVEMRARIKNVILRPTAARRGREPDRSDVTHDEDGSLVMAFPRPDDERRDSAIDRITAAAAAAAADHVAAFRFTIDVSPDPEHPSAWVATCHDLGTVSAACTPHDALAALGGAVKLVVGGILEARGTPGSGLEVLREIAAGHAAQRRAPGPAEEAAACALLAAAGAAPEPPICPRCQNTGVEHVPADGFTPTGRRACACPLGRQPDR